MNFDAVILAGGKSSRMNRDKAFLEIDGRNLLSRQIELAREAGAAKVFISGHTRTDYSSFNCPVLEDKFQDAGPLGGIERALDTTSAPLLLVIAVDLPNLTVNLLNTLFRQCEKERGAIPRINENIEPLVAFYPKASHPILVELLDKNSNAVQNFAASCVASNLAAFVDISADNAELFLNWNSPSDLQTRTQP